MNVRAACDDRLDGAARAVRMQCNYFAVELAVEPPPRRRRRRRHRHHATTTSPVSAGRRGDDLSPTPRPPRPSRDRATPAPCVVEPGWLAGRSESDHGGGGRLRGRGRADNGPRVR